MIKTQKRYILIENKIVKNTKQKSGSMAYNGFDTDSGSGVSLRPQHHVLCVRSEMHCHLAFGKASVSFGEQSMAQGPG